MPRASQIGGFDVVAALPFLLALVVVLAPLLLARPPEPPDPGDEDPGGGGNGPDTWRRPPSPPGEPGLMDAQPARIRRRDHTQPATLRPPRTRRRAHEERPRVPHASAWPWPRRLRRPAPARTGT